MKKLFEAVYNQNVFTLNEAKVTDYIDADELGEICSTNPILKVYKDCEPVEGMLLKMTGDEGIAYYKVIKNDDGKFEAYLVDESGKALGDLFLLESEQPINIKELADRVYANIEANYKGSEINPESIYFEVIKQVDEPDDDSDLRYQVYSEIMSDWEWSDPNEKKDWEEYMENYYDVYLADMINESEEIFKPLKFKDTGEGFEIATRKGITFEIFYEEGEDEPYKAQIESGYSPEDDTFDEWIYDYDKSFKTHEEAVNYLNDVCKEILSEKKNSSDINK